MPTPHKHAALIKAWADGAEIQYFDPAAGLWSDMLVPGWNPERQYRVKPEPVKYRLYQYVEKPGFAGPSGFFFCIQSDKPDLAKRVEHSVIRGACVWLTDWLELPEQSS